jgi:hypothetical protein
MLSDDDGNWHLRDIISLTMRKESSTEDVFVLCRGRRSGGGGKRSCKTTFTELAASDTAPCLFVLSGRSIRSCPSPTARVTETRNYGFRCRGKAEGARSLKPPGTVKNPIIKH